MGPQLVLGAEGRAGKPVAHRHRLGLCWKSPASPTKRAAPCLCQGQEQNQLAAAPLAQRSLPSSPRSAFTG